MDKGFFGSLFDFNEDGKLDSPERTADFAAFVELTSSSDDEDAGIDSDDYDD